VRLYSVQSCRFVPCAKQGGSVNARLVLTRFFRDGHFLPGVDRASACGESMFRVGRASTTCLFGPIPGTVLVYARTIASGGGERLQEAGHEVLVVDSDIDLA